MLENSISEKAKPVGATLVVVRLGSSCIKNNPSLHESGQPQGLPLPNSVNPFLQ